MPKCPRIRVKRGTHDIACTHRGVQEQAAAAAPTAWHTSCLSRKLGARRGRLTTGKCASGCANGTSSCALSAAGQHLTPAHGGEGSESKSIFKSVCMSGSECTDKTVPVWSC